MRARSLCRRLDDGAAAVEFAILLPLFLVLVFGMISGGLTFEKWISATQAARESSRFAATLPVGGTTISAWLDSVGQVAAENAGVNLTTTPQTEYFICVRFVNQVGPGSTPATTMKTWGTLASASGSCNGSTTSDNRVEVVVQRKATFDWVFGGSNLKVTGSNTSLYEPTVP